MQEIETVGKQVRSPTRRLVPGRWIFVGVCAGTLLLLGLLPPLVSVSRYQRRISTSISSSLGRPVHFDSVALNLLPIPSFTISNFVVEDDPNFGAEPIIRANSVTAFLRLRSLLHRHVEFSRINLNDPSVNLVRDNRGKWNIESILLQASQIVTAPTAQQSAGVAPRFPYIEATGARVNFKKGLEKLPFSLSEADFALWLSDPRQWQTRLKARPIRTNSSVSDTGTVQVEATLSRAESLDSVPIHLQGTWRDAPLGEASRLLLARDLGLRGDLNVAVELRGSLGENRFKTHVFVDHLRRSEFVPQEDGTLDLQCSGTATKTFRTLTTLGCSWPVGGAGGATLAVAGDVPDVLRPRDADVQIGTSRLPVSVLLRWFRIASSRAPPGVVAKGFVSGSFRYDPALAATWTGQMEIAALSLSGAELGTSPMNVASLLVRSDDAPQAARGRSPAAAAASSFVLSPVALPLGGREDATLEGSANAEGYQLHLRGDVVVGRLLALGHAFPKLGDGLAAVLPSAPGEEPVAVDLSCHREWSGGQRWMDNFARPAAVPRSGTHRRRR